MKIRKSLFLKFFQLFFLSGIIFLISCAKASSDPDKNTSTAPAGNTSNTQFTWSNNAGNSVTADSSNYYASFTTIFAFKNGVINSLEINLSSLNVGAYSLSNLTGNALTYIVNSTTYTAKSGTVNITANNNAGLTGNFNCALAGGTLTSLSGQFTEIPKR
jgi:hypothetical protein